MSISLPVAALATFISHPFEFLKTKIQIRNEGIGIRKFNYQMGVSMNRVFSELHTSGYGTSSLYNGFSFALYARMSYIFVRNTAYYMMYQQVKPPKPTNDISVREKALLSAFAGSLGAIVSNPFEILAVRQIGDFSRENKFNRNISNSLSELSKVNVTRGMGLNILKAIVLNASMTYPYDYIKECMWNVFGPVIVNNIVALLIASGIGTLASLPIDNLKTRFQYSFDNKSLNRINYKNELECLSHVITKERTSSLWIGLHASYLKNLSYATCTLYISDYFINKIRQSNGVKVYL